MYMKSKYICFKEENVAWINLQLSTCIPKLAVVLLSTGKILYLIKAMYCYGIIAFCTMCVWITSIKFRPLPHRN